MTDHIAEADEARRRAFGRGTPTPTEESVARAFGHGTPTPTEESVAVARAFGRDVEADGPMSLFEAQGILTDHAFGRRVEAERLNEARALIDGESAPAAPVAASGDLAAEAETLLGELPALYESRLAYSPQTAQATTDYLRRQWEGAPAYSRQHQIESLRRRVSELRSDLPLSEARPASRPTPKTPAPVPVRNTTEAAPPEQGSVFGFGISSMLRESE